MEVTVAQQSHKLFPKGQVGSTPTPATILYEVFV